MHLAAGISVGMTGLAAGYGIGVIGEHGVRSYVRQSRIFMPLVLMLIFAEVLGLYGYVALRNWVFGLTYYRLIVALILNSRTKG